MSDLKQPEWQKLYDDAVAETDREALVARIRAAKVAVVSRMKTIQITSETRAEASALEGALRNLIVLAYERSKLKKYEAVASPPSQVDSQSD